MRAVAKAGLPGYKRGFAEVDSEAKDAVRKLQRFAQEEHTRVDPVCGQRGGDPNDRLCNLKMLLNMKPYTEIFKREVASAH